MRVFFFCTNVAKLLLWIGAIYPLVHYFGAILGTLIIVVGATLWNVYQSISANYTLDQHPWGVEQAEWHTNILLVFFGYGCFGGPRWGLDNEATAGLIPIDGFDQSAKDHDQNMLYAKTLSNADARRKAKNDGDATFIADIWTSYSRTHGFYIFGASVGFLARIIGRTVIE